MWLCLKAKWAIKSQNIIYKKHIITIWSQVQNRSEPDRILPLDRRTMFSRNVFWGATRPRRPLAILPSFCSEQNELLPAAHILHINTSFARCIVCACARSLPTSAGSLLADYCCTSFEMGQRLAVIERASNICWERGWMPEEWERRINALYSEHYIIITSLIVIKNTADHNISVLRKRTTVSNCACSENKCVFFFTLCWKCKVGPPKRNQCASKCCTWVSRGEGFRSLFQREIVFKSSALWQVQRLF